MGAEIGPGGIHRARDGGRDRARHGGRDGTKANYISRSLGLELGWGTPAGSGIRVNEEARDIFSQFASDNLSCVRF